LRFELLDAINVTLRHTFSLITFLIMHLIGVTSLMFFANFRKIKNVKN